MKRFVHPGSRARIAAAACLTAGIVTAATAIAAPAPRAKPRPALRSAPVAASGVRDDGVLLLSLGQSKVINLPVPMSDVVIADPNVVDVHVRTTRQLYLIPKAAGQSDFTVTNDAGKPIYKAIIRVGNNLTSIDQMLKLAMPDADITVTTLNGTILLTGTIATPEDAQEAESLVAAFTKSPVISRLKTATPLTVNLQVRIAEVSKTLTKSFGMNVLTRDNSGGFLFGLSRGAPGSIGYVNRITGETSNIPKPGMSTQYTFNNPGSSTTTSLGMAGRLFGLDVLSTLDLAENQGLATTLANPNLTALSGETASFLAGGEIPIPLSSSLGQVSVDYKQYGVSLSFTPTVLADGRISMRVKPEVSSLDYGKGVTLGGYVLPGIASRRAETTVELGSGQSFMIGGLLQADTGNSVEKAPFLGDIPILGNLFKSSGFRRNQTELVIIVTPYLVKPVDARDGKLPTDGYRNATDPQRLLGTMLHDSNNEPRPMPQMAPPVIVPSGSTPPMPGGPATGGSADASPAATPRKSGKADASPGFSF